MLLQFCKWLPLCIFIWNFLFNWIFQGKYHNLIHDFQSLSHQHYNRILSTFRRPRQTLYGRQKYICRKQELFHLAFVPQCAVWILELVSCLFIFHHQEPAILANLQPQQVLSLSAQLDQKLCTLECVSAFGRSL